MTIRRSPLIIFHDTSLNIAEDYLLVQCTRSECLSVSSSLTITDDRAGREVLGVNWLSLHDDDGGSCHLPGHQSAPVRATSGHWPLVCVMCLLLRYFSGYSQKEVWPVQHDGSKMFAKVVFVLIVSKHLGIACSGPDGQLAKQSFS